MNSMKKMFSLMIGSVLSITMLGISVLGFVNGEEPYGNKFGDAQTSSNVGVPGTGTAQGDKLITSIKLAINRILGMLALIALVVLLRGGFQMVTAAGDDAKYKKGFKILQQSGMGLIFIGIAWLFVSVIFWIVAKFTT